jgi:dipeptidyl aminopeptidase/acylaminoacyl peptidase
MLRRKSLFRVFLIVLSSVALLSLLASWGVAAVLAEGSLHPPLHRRASDTAALAISIARGSVGSAQPVVISASDGTHLSAWWLLPPHPGDRAVLVCHGVADSGFGVMGDAALFLRNGYSVLVPDSRGHGQSGGFVTYGVLESGDILRWLSWMAQHGVHAAYGFGESLGGAILLQSLAQGAHLQAVVAESSYASFHQVAYERVARYLKPALVAAIIVDEALVYVRLRYGVNLSDASPQDAVANSHIPVLLIHGMDDDETLPIHSQQIAARNPRCVKLWLVSHAKHTGAYAADPAKFETAVLTWFRVHVTDSVT